MDGKDTAAHEHARRQEGFPKSRFAEEAGALGTDLASEHPMERYPAGDKRVNDPLTDDDDLLRLHVDQDPPAICWGWSMSTGMIATMIVPGLRAAQLRRAASSQLKSEPDPSSVVVSTRITNCPRMSWSGYLSGSFS